MNKHQSLINLDFSPGIKASEINHNFNLLEKWQNKERIRIGGYGIVSGFNLTADVPNFTINISEGSFITKEGKELVVKATSIPARKPEYFKKEEILYCNSEGIILLTHKPYSYSQTKCLRYVQTEDSPAFNLSEELNIVNNDTTENVPILQIIGKKIYVDPQRWSRKPLKVNYHYAENRVDTILLNEDGEYRYERSVISPNPSHVQLQDYSDEYVIGTALWNIDEEITVTFHTNHRLYRTLYVDDDNNLWLNGRRFYNQSIINFVKPLNPQPRDLWYDEINKCLFIYQEEDGEFSWHLINNRSGLYLKDKYVFSSKLNNFPRDAKTFIFPSELLDLIYVPNQNALEIIIDNVPIMQDQFREIVEEGPGNRNYLDRGIGFSLVEPLDDNNSVVEVIINHQVQNKNLLKTFQKASIFVNTGYVAHTNSNRNKVYRTEMDYIVGDNQLEVFVDGVKLIPEYHFTEMINETTESTQIQRRNRNIKSKYFKINNSFTRLNNNSLIEYKISRYIWNYEHINLIVDEIENNIKVNKNSITSLTTRFEEANRFLNSNINSLREENTRIKATIPNESLFYKKAQKITVTDLDYTVSNKLINRNFFNLTMNTTNLSIIPNASINDYIQIYKYSEVNNVPKEILVPNLDYTLTQESSGVTINLKPTLIDVNYFLYVTGFKVGV